MGLKAFNEKDVCSKVGYANARGREANVGE